jgi:hypothetical protein
MLDLLRRANQGRIQGRFPFEFFGHLVALLDQPLHRFAGLLLHRLTELFIDLVEAANLFLGLFQVFFESSAQFFGLRGFRHFRQRLC